ncbi:unnamed protein product [Adineta steineri]|uniref:Uncharacterized protein n=2 Tax=Adineta steineri TaxID=433720 RepID=A0A818ZAE7_9BILA|nr:unnamed protein product [Adineta steineri]
MPTAWLGLWYQRGMNSLLEITNDQIQSKGFCLDVLSAQQYYLFNDRINLCTRCLLFIPRHINLLQYRESECIDVDEQLNITACPNMIALDAALYTLHRNDSKSQSCPIQPPFQLTNLIKHGSVCHQSISSSYMNECVDHDQFHLHFTPCLSYQPVLDFQFTCVGTWIEDFDTYFVTRILSHNHQNNQYACFRFSTKEKSSSSLSLYMATDDSCHDIYSKHMSTVINLSTKNDPMNHDCIFPKEFQSYEWYSINRTIRMIIKNYDIEFIGINKRFHCQEVIHSEKSISIYRIRTLTNCHMKEECLRIIQQTNNVIELYTKSLSNGNNCSYFNNENYSLYETFFTKSFAISNSCPTHIGYLIYQSNTDYYLKRKSFLMSVGCDNKEKLIISQKQKDLEHRSVMQSDICLASWQSKDHSTTYLIAQSKFSNASYCLSFQITNEVLIRNNSNGCSFNNHADDKTISIYSARLINPCSQSQQLPSNFLLLFTTIFFSMNTIR